VLSRPVFWLAPAALLILGTALVIPSALELVRTGATYLHWSRFVAMSFCHSTALILLVAGLVHYVLDLLECQLGYLRARVPGYADSEEETGTPAGAAVAASSSRPS
jgi:hypothetical protein